MVASARPRGGGGGRGTDGAGAEVGGGGARGPVEQPGILMPTSGSTAIATTNPVTPVARTTREEGEGAVDGPAIQAAAVAATDDGPR